MLVPATIWKLVKLRNLHIYGNSVHVESAEELLEDFSKLPELGTLCTLCLCLGCQLMFRKAPNLLELKCKFWGGSSGEFCVLDFPTQLEYLHISRELYDQKFPVCIYQSNLKELRVANFRMRIQQLSNIGQLQKLQSLHLSFIKFDDEKWEVSDDEFPQLKVLKLYKCSSLNEWSVADDAFPNLERLVLDACWTLIPSCFR